MTPKALIKKMVITKMRHLNFKRYSKFEDSLEKLSQEALNEFNRFLQDLEYKITQLEKRVRRGF